MITRNSIDLKYCDSKCAHQMSIDACRILSELNPECNYRCPFYKPEGCDDWIRVEDRNGIAVVPPEEYYESKTIRRRLQWV